MQEINLAAAVITIFKAVGPWPLAALMVVIFVVVPLIIAFVLNKLASVMMSLRDEVRTDTKKQQDFYNNNVELVKNYAALADNLMQVVQVNSENMANLGSLIKQFLRNGK